ncbi:MAG TPA: hypothetical protein VFW40_13125 [Capsulimonadaceae bacterium]|nr:hypothetical protein [Capsulimonadaceae bacterium]
MSEKIREESSHVVTSNKHVLDLEARDAEGEIEGMKGGLARSMTQPGAGRPDGPVDDGSAGGPTVGGAWGGMQADGKSDTSTDEMSVVEEIKPRPSESL